MATIDKRIESRLDWFWRGLRLRRLQRPSPSPLPPHVAAYIPTSTPYVDQGAGGQRDNKATHLRLNLAYPAMMHWQRTQQRSFRIPTLSHKTHNNRYPATRSVSTQFHPNPRSPLPTNTQDGLALTPSSQSRHRRRDQQHKGCPLLPPQTWKESTRLLRLNVLHCITKTRAPRPRP